MEAIPDHVSNCAVKFVTVKLVAMSYPKRRENLLLTFTHVCEMGQLRSIKRLSTKGYGHSNYQLNNTAIKNSFWS